MEVAMFIVFDPTRLCSLLSGRVRGGCAVLNIVKNDCKLATVFNIRDLLYILRLFGSDLTKKMGYKPRPFRTAFLDS